MAKTYAEKLRDPRWQKKRLEIMSRDKFKCRHCHSEENTLNVHHSYYRAGCAPWDYPDESLVTVCETCHKKLEDLRVSFGEATSMSTAKCEMFRELLCSKTFIEFNDLLSFWVSALAHIRDSSALPQDIQLLRDATSRLVFTIESGITAAEAKMHRIENQ